jgi:hypothetical protein
MDPRRKLTSAAEPALRQLLQDLEVHRHPLARDTRHSLYRQQSERWLESIVRSDVTHIDAALDARFVYAQVFPNTFSERGILDLLTVTRAGRLAILALKATEHIHLPLQAANYWLRIRRHLLQILRGMVISLESSCSLWLPSCIWLRRRCAFIPRPMHCCAISRRRCRFFAWASRKVGAANSAS